MRSACKAKSRHLAEFSIVAFFRTFPVSTYFLTLTEPGRKEGEAHWSKDEAEERLRPLIDRFRRDGVAHLVFWERQKRGSWHPHMLISKRYDVVWLREWLGQRGWGRQLRAQRVVVPMSCFSSKHGFGFGRQCASDLDLPAWRLVRYLVKYLTKSTVEDTCSRKKLFGGSRVSKCGTVGFKWVPSVNASSYLYHYGREMFVLIEGRPPTFRDTTYVIRLGVEACDWLSVDPWWEPYSPPPP